jgi:two-component system, OmpR family, response regulator
VVAFPTARCVLGSAGSAVRGRRKRRLPHDDSAAPLSDDSSMRVLVVEDDVKLASLIRRGLRADGLLADVAIKGEDALWMAASSPYDVLTLDLGLVGMDGVEVCRRLRADDVRTPILMLTARDAVEDRIAGLDAGADDYLVKPFDFGELLARLRALARRGPAEQGTVLRVADLTLDPATRRVRRGDREVELSTKEFQLLEAFMRHPDQVLTRYQLLERAWDAAYEHRSNVINVYVRYLREKLDRPFGVQSIETVRGAGYRMRAA